MRTLLIAAVVLLASTQLSAQTDSILISDPETKTIDDTHFHDSDDRERTHSIFIWVPGIITRGASWFIDKDEEPEVKSVLKYVGGITVRVLSGDPTSRKWQRKTNRWQRKIERKRLDDMIVVKAGGAQVHIKAGYVDKGKLKNFAILVDAEDAAVFLTGRGRMDLNKIMKLINEEDGSISL